MEPVEAAVPSLTRAGIWDVAGALALKRKGSVEPLRGALLQTQVVWGEPGADSCPQSSLRPPHRPSRAAAGWARAKCRESERGSTTCMWNQGPAEAPSTPTRRPRGAVAIQTPAQPRHAQKHGSQGAQLSISTDTPLALWPHPPLPSIPNSWPPLTHSPPPS